MADALLLEYFAYFCHGVVGGHAGGLVDVEYAVHIISYS